MKNKTLDSILDKAEWIPYIGIYSFFFKALEGKSSILTKEVIEQRRITGNHGLKQLSAREAVWGTWQALSTSALSYALPKAYNYIAPYIN